MSTVAIGYIRVSTDEQAESGLGLEAQERTIKAYADLHGLDLEGIQVDAGVGGGSRSGREGLSAALSAVEAEGGHLIVAKLDRLTRSVRDALDIVEEAEVRGWSLHSVHERLDTGSAMGRFVTTIIAAVAELERGLISERTKAALAAKRARGEQLGRPPVGALLPMAMVEAIREWRVEGLSQREIARRLHEAGLRTSAGSKWTHKSVGRLLGRMG